MSDIIHMCFGGPIQSITDAKGRRWRFEMHPYCGPVVVNKNDDPSATQPGSRSPFWAAFELWDKQGHKVVDGECVYGPSTEPKPILEHIGGKHYMIVGHTDAAASQRREA